MHDPLRLHGLRFAQDRLELRHESLQLVDGQHPERLAGDARVQQAVDAAGGFAEDAAVDAINLAREIKDGEQIIVPSLQQANGSEVPAGADTGLPAASAGGAFANGKVDINTATPDQLQQLNGVGPALAQRIVADRQANGPFKTVEELKRVSGIGDKKYASLADSICVG